MKHLPDRRAPLRREERWLRRGMRAIVTLTLILLAVTIVDVSTTLTNREQQVARAEVVEQLQAVTDQLDRQAARLADAQAETAASRTQFREAIRMLLDALDVADGDPFTDVPTPD